MCCTTVLVRRWGRLAPSPPCGSKPEFCVLSLESRPVSHSRHVCCVTQQEGLLCHTANTSAVSRGRHGCCVTRQTWLLCHTSEFPSKQLLFFGVPRTAKLYTFSIWGRAKNNSIEIGIFYMRQVSWAHKVAFCTNIYTCKQGTRARPLGLIQSAILVPGRPNGAPFS